MRLIGILTGLLASLAFSAYAMADSLFVNAQTGTTYTFVNTDCGKLVTFNNAAAIAATLPQASSASGGGAGAGTFMPPCAISVQNIGAGTLTITPTTSTINGQATLVVAQGQGAAIASDGTNYQIQPGTAGLAINSPYVAGAVDFLQLTPSATGTPGNVKATAIGTDTNVNTLVQSKGTGAVYVGGTTAANASVQIPTVASAVNQIVATPSATGNVPTVTLGGSGADANRALAINGNGTGGVLVGGTTAANAGLQVGAPASAVNEIVVTPAATLNIPSIAIGGSSADANRALAVNGIGTGGVLLGGTSAVNSAFQVVPAASGVNDFVATSAATLGLPTLLVGGTSADANASGLIGPNGTGSLYLGGTTAANASVGVPTTSLSVNQIVLTSGATGAVPTITLGGSGADANRALAVNGKGTGGVLIGGTTTTLAGLQVGSVATQVNDVVITPSATGTAPTIALGGAGADANRNLNIAGSGTGIVTLGQAICTATGVSPQTCNGQRGIVTTGTLTTAAVTDASFTINDSSVASTSLIECTDQAYSGTLVTNGIPVITTCVPGVGTITVHITNVHAANALSGTVQIGFAVLN